MAVIARAADWFVVGAVGVAERARVPKVLIGATLVSILTTTPELIVSATAAVLERPATAVGNAVGSVIGNTGLILATAMLIRPITTDRPLLLRQGGWMLGAGLALLVLAAGAGGLSRGRGVLLLAGLAGYLAHSAMLARAEQAPVLAERAEAFGTLKYVALSGAAPSSAWRLGATVVAGGLGVAGGSVLLVQNAVILARWLGVPELVIALTLVAVGTSVPEYVTTVTATLRGYTDLGVGNIIGANVLNVLWVLGTAAVLRPLALAPGAPVLDLVVMLGFMLLLLLLGATRGRYERWEGALLLGLYAGYVLARVGLGRP